MRLVILDRDGVINRESPDYIKSPEEWEALPGSLEAIARLVRHDYKVVVITNQAGIGRGLMNVDALNKIHLRMLEEVRHKGGNIEAVLFCPHHPDENCNCRKPRTGLFDELAQRLGISLQGTPMIGDSLRDVQAARAAGAFPVLVQSSEYGARLAPQGVIKDPPGLEQVPVFTDLAACTDALLYGDLLPAEASGGNTGDGRG